MMANTRRTPGSGRRIALLIIALKGTLFSRLLLATGSEVAAIEPAAAVQTLTNGSSRKWTFIEERVIQGEGGCIHGETYRFFADHTLRIRRCENNQWLETIRHWRLATGPVDVELHIDDNTYRILFYERDGKARMTLRLPAPDKMTPTVDRDFWAEKTARP